MEYIDIFGGNELSGEIEISGSKNSVLPILASTILSDKGLTLSNVPKLVDVKSMINLIASLGVKVEKKKEKILFHTKKIISHEANYNLVRKMRASFLVLGPLLARDGYARISLPGGCAIGTRPVDLHLLAMKKLGANIDFSDGYVIAKSHRKGLVGNKIEFPKLSVGATENAIMAATLAKGETLITNAAKEPEVIDLCNCLLSMGVLIEGIGTNKIYIQGVAKLLECSHEVITDRIEACTFIIAAAITKSNLKINKINFKHIKLFINIIKKMGLKFLEKEDQIQIVKSENLQPILVKTEEYPGFPTDMQAQLMTLACLSDGISEIEENIFENRFMHVPELNRLGAKIIINGNKAIIHGNRKFIGAEVMATDLRASVSLILAALVAKGKTRINRIYHLDRGYENIDFKLSSCGAKIRRGN
ncbi:MAG: UDP-N-acetylglucosamine 1-carboxyvinyltransferase [Rickettsiales bacterium]|nr:UDP-N-acetylglucosamine 1-carboxyvinyltransferase [Rickettsiales bacterium]OUV79493.1 MAG: UDP-N-acetylglucosamine 1-carboxyvinyltransferase [Rickettsiales bacterium TMED131]